MTGANEMECVRISELKTDLDDYTWSYESGNGMCILDSSKNDQCKYYYKDSAGTQKLINSDYCECSLMQETEDAKSLPGP